MKTVNIHEAKTHLSRLIEAATKGEPFVIAKAGKPVVKVMAIDDHSAAKAGRLGFLEGELKVPGDFDRLGEKEIERLFGGKPE